MFSLTNDTTRREAKLSKNRLVVPCLSKIQHTVKVGSYSSITPLPTVYIEFCCMNSSVAWFLHLTTPYANNIKNFF